MEIFYTYNIDGSICRLDSEESAHCVRVLRHRVGDEIDVIDGLGAKYRCSIVQADAKETICSILSTEKGWGAHPYDLTMAVCPTKNIDRYEWFVEKAVEIGCDSIVPVIGERSERKIIKTDRLRRIALSATKQSLKAAIPQVQEPLSVRDFIESSRGDGALKFIAYCFEGEMPRVSLRQAVLQGAIPSPCKISVLIGPEGDFSPEEAALAVEAGFVPVHLGPSRLRTETAAVFSVAAIYDALCM